MSPRGFREKETSDKEEENVFCTVRADELPEEPSNAFLMRADKKPEVETADGVDKPPSKDDRR